MISPQLSETTWCCLQHRLLEFSDEFSGMVSSPLLFMWGVVSKLCMYIKKYFGCYMWCLNILVVCFIFYTLKLALHTFTGVLWDTRTSIVSAKAHAQYWKLN